MHTADPPPTCSEQRMARLRPLVHAIAPCARHAVPEGFRRLIAIEDVSKRYADGTVAVDRLSLQIPDHSITVLVGPSGCGKTTTLRMINRMVEPSSGTIRVDGEDIQRQPVNALRRSMGYVIQNAGLFQHRTILDNIATVPRLLGWSKQRARDRAADLMERVGLDTGDGPPLPVPALRRPAAARRGRPRAGRRPAHPADGRAVLRGRPGRAPRSAGGVAAHPGRTGQGHRLRHPRHGRGHHDRRPHRGAAHRRETRAVRRAGRDPVRAGRRVRRGVPRRRPGHPRAVVPLHPGPRTGPLARRRRRFRCPGGRRTGHAAGAGARDRRGRRAPRLGPAGLGRRDGHPRTLRAAFRGGPGLAARGALDRAVLSPAGQAVGVDAAGVVLGVAGQDTIAAAIRAARRGGSPGAPLDAAACAKAL